MKLHVLPPSANSHGSIAVVRELGLDNVEIENAFGKTRTPEFIAMNPCHTCPTLELDDGTAIWESNAVMRYLTTLSEDGVKLYPKDPVQRAKLDMVLDWRQTEYYPKLPEMGYGAFGLPVTDEKAREDFKSLMEVQFKTLTDVWLKDGKKFIFSDTPTIADLAVACPLTFLLARKKFWEKVPDRVKQYRTDVLEAFPHTKENFDMFVGIMEGWESDSANIDP